MLPTEAEGHGIAHCAQGAPFSLGCTAEMSRGAQGAQRPDLEKSCRSGDGEVMSGEGQQEQRAAAGLSSEATPSTTAWGAGAASPTGSITPFLLHCSHLVTTDAIPADTAQLAGHVAHHLRQEHENQGATRGKPQRGDDAPNSVFHSFRHLPLTWSREEKLFRERQV